MAPSPSTSRWLVSTEWLAERLGKSEVAVVDGSYHLIADRNARAEYREGHIPGAVFFDIEAISDHSTDLPHMLPGPDQFGEQVGALGISDGDTIVVYENGSLFAAARVWWTFRIFGAEKVFILDGGLPKWKAEKRPLEQGEGKRAPSTFKAEMNTGAVAMLSDVQLALTDDSIQVVDARSAERFRGEAPEPRPDVRPGHIPGALNVPYAGLLQDGRLAAPEQLRKAFAAGKVDLDKPIITSCGSGVTAAMLWLALDVLGKEPRGLYDGSWAEWGSRPDMPAATGK